MLYALAGLISVLFLVADQLTKSYIATNFTLTESVPFIEGLIDITYIHNQGGAWGIMDGHTWLLLSLTLLIMIVCIAMVVKNGFKSKLLFFSVCLVISGGIGNMIDRIFRSGTVIDFIHLHFMPDFPVFNIADCAVCIGAILLFLYFIIDMIKDYKIRRATETVIYSTPSSDETEEDTDK